MHCYSYEVAAYVYVNSLAYVCTCIHILLSGADPGFLKGGSLMYKLYIAIVHIIILNKVHYSLLKAIVA